MLWSFFFFFERYKTPVFLRGFKVSASFYIGKQADNGAQGIAFVIQNSGLTSSGGVGAGMGYSSPVVNPISGIKNSLAIEFDCQQNSDMNGTIFSFFFSSRLS